MSDRPDSTLGVFGAQTTLLPAGDGAAATLGLTAAFIYVGLALFVLVMGIVWYAWVRSPGGRTWWIVGGGIVLPLVTIAVLFVASTGVLRAIAGERPHALTIAVTGQQFWWDVVYDPHGLAIRDANEIVVPVGVPVRFELRAEDVIHSFWVPPVSGKMDMIPGRTNELTVTATEQGRFRGQCAEFCGLSHPLMALEFVAVPPAHFRAFLEDLQAPVDPPAGPAAPLGQTVFLEAGCPACHEIRGVATGARLGPDLTRVGARAAIGAGMWPMNEGALAGWIADVQDMKPGAAMPSYGHLPGRDLRALAEWLESLK